MKKAFYLLTNLILSLLCIYAIHDMQTAQGVGYYFALKSGKDRLPFDIITDFVFVIFLFIALVLPLVISRAKMSFAYSRFVILFVALIPTLRADYVFSIFFNGNFLSEKYNFDTWATQVMTAFSVVVPMFVLALGLSMVIQKEKLSRKNKYLMIDVVVLFVISALLPGLSELFLFIGAYILIFIIFSIFEKSELDSLWLYGFLFATAVYRIISVTAAWN